PPSRHVRNLPGDGGENRGEKLRPYPGLIEDSNMSASCRPTDGRRCPGITRRSFLADTGMGFTGLALGAMLFRDGVARAEPVHLPPDGKPHFPPRARSVIWIFLCGGVSHVESFDPKPELNQYAGKTIDATPYKDVLNPDKLKDVIAGNP